MHHRRRRAEPFSRMSRRFAPRSARMVRCHARAPDTYLAVDRSRVDVLRFEDDVADVLADASSDPESAAFRLAEVLSVWAEPLAGTTLSDGFRSVLAPFEELHLQAVEALSVARIDSGDAGVAVRELESLVREHPTREHLWLQLARGLAAFWATQRRAPSAPTGSRSTPRTVGYRPGDPTPDAGTGVTRRP